MSAVDGAIHTQKGGVENKEAPWKWMVANYFFQPPTTFIAAVVILKALTADTDCTSTDESSDQKAY